MRESVPISGPLRFALAAGEILSEHADLQGWHGQEKAATAEAKKKGNRGWA
jgi:hypothetical protein